MTISSIEVIAGPMRSRKSDELILCFEPIVTLMGQNAVRVFKPRKDSRVLLPGQAGMGTVQSRRGTKMSAIDIDHPLDVLAHLRSPGAQDVVAIGIEEVHLFDDPEGFERLHHHLTYECPPTLQRVIYCGCDTNFKGEPFRIMGYLMCVATLVKKTKSLCERCQPTPVVEHATRTGRMGHSTEEIQIGDAPYVATCLGCHHKFFLS
ncbi:hypothetical protein HYV73_04850 [Candidatus Uhrbacteria bacterium]|nr:hypothetical protein [Candidatus Uhrbacteria bacterium]